MDKIQDKAARLVKIRDYLFDISPQGVSSAELGRIFEISRSAALKNLYSVSELWSSIYQDDDKLWYFDPEAKLINVSLNEDEVQILHIASRLYHQSVKNRFPASVSFLNKLADASAGTSSALAEMIKETAVEIGEAGDNPDELYTQIIRKINTALHRERNLSVTYRKKDGSLGSYQLLPLMLEPYTSGKSLYLIAYDNLKKRILTLRTERMVEVELIGASRLINREGEISLRDEIRELRQRIREERQFSWGIWGDSRERVSIKLLFDRDVADRVRQTVWHPRQKLADQSSGKILWELELSGVKEIIPWIRSWGSSVEVLEPAGLREIIFQDIKKNKEKYK